MTKRIHMTVTMLVTPAQALALKAMFDYWNQLSLRGATRKVGFYVDGDGNFHPKCEVTFSEELPELTDELRRAAIVEESDGDRLYDYDPVAWRLNHDDTLQLKNKV